MAAASPARAPAERVALALALVLAAARLAAGAVSYDDALWNAYTKYEAGRVHADLLFRSPNGALGPPLFPLEGGWDAEAQCNGPSRPFPSAAAKNAPGACEYTPTGGDMYSFWQKVPGDRLRRSNCYCYAVDHRDGDGWCFPGMGGGMGDLSPATLSCEDLTARVVADGAVKVDRAAAVGGAVPAEGHYIAMFYRPQSSCDFSHCGPDFHFARRDSNGRWSHKTGDSPVSDKDADGKAITDPQAAKFNGGYSSFCGYFLVKPQSARIGVQAAPDRVSMGVQRWRDAGLEVRAKTLPYDPATDFVDEAARAQQRVQLQRLQGPPQGTVQLLRQAAPAPTNGGRKLLRGA
ncbi:hypothetical protein Rsub_04972 [Raphidocelis subcapitata]|uniref:Uncharacterized protein n=1 Tax=Raphidocelis subcapitata TaxID=307507 RepID=A0A2V0P3T2_9CHLO|nr:hypothetical protein Rsub_04972 [Raphidocelis subcapitata]|eukprot:GBF91867.1 hypothetical protein Rsub_04972 [Raphidocelis subcapitata]